jgi:hypothetical protein
MFAATRSSLVASALLLLAACGGAPAPDDAAGKAERSAEAEALGRDTDETVFDDMIDTQERARGVEDLTLGRKDELDQAMEAAEGDEPGDE